MTLVSTKIECPRCGAEMNFHAEKIVYGAGEEGRLDETLQQFHACPQCGTATYRNVASEPEGF